MGWFDDILVKKNKQNEDGRESSGFAYSSSGGVPGGEAAQARELINRSAHAVLKDSGISKDWLRFEILTLNDAAKSYFQLQVTIRHWDAYLLLHSRAFEQVLLLRIAEENGAVAKALRAVLWRVHPESGCPYGSLPPSVAWTPEAIAQRAQNLELFKAKKPHDARSAEWAGQQHDDAFLSTLQVPRSSAEADAELQQVLHAEQMGKAAP